MAYNLNMALDGIILSKIKDDLIKHLPMRINRIINISDTELVFNVLADRQRQNLIISLHSLYNRICLSDRNYNTYDNPSGFVMLLRKYIADGIITAIEQVDYDRLLILHISAQNDIYDRKNYRLYVELMGKYANLILVDGESGKIIDALKRIPPYENNKRTIQSGAIYELVAPQNKKDPFKNDTVDLNESLVKQFSGFSKLLENEVRFRLEKTSFKDIMKTVKEADKLYITRINDEIYYHIIPLTHLSEEYECYDLKKGFDIVYYDLEEKDRIKKSSDDIIKFVKKQYKHYREKIAKLEEMYRESLNPEELKENGDLLYTYGNLQIKGLKSVKLLDFNGKEKEIILDPKKSIKENANRYYQNYHKKKKSGTYIAEQLASAKEELAYFASLDEQLDMANVLDAEAIKEELVKYGYLKAHKKQNYKRKSSTPKVYQLHFKGHTITFGKNHLQNNYVSFKYAKPEYLWFHAQGYHGCHLVVDDSNPDEETIRFCANLAAYFSKGRYSSSVPVDYCAVKDVKKIKGSKSGLVTIRHQKTIYIDPVFDHNLKISLV